jgi:alanine dehydrogenase
MIIIGIPKEIKANERRVSMAPEEVGKLVNDGYYVCVESGAGEGAGFKDDDYLKVGARIGRDRDEIYDKSNVIIKVKEPQEEEYRYINARHTILTFFHFASNERLREAMAKSGARCIAYETIVDKDGKYPILAPMSVIAGEEAMRYGDMYIEGDRTSEVLIIGCGNVGMASYKKAIELGYKKIRMMENDINKLDKLRKDGYDMYEMTEDNLSMLLGRCLIVIGCVYIKGEKATQVIKNDMMFKMMDGSIIIDVAIDQGGITEQSRVTTIDKPLIRYGRTSIYCVPNIPACVPREATEVLSRAIYRYVSESGLFKMGDMDREG